jgi:hypothetical protein
VKAFAESILSSPGGPGSPRGRIGILPIICSALNPARLKFSPSLRLDGRLKELATDAETECPAKGGAC